MCGAAMLLCFTIRSAVAGEARGRHPRDRLRIEDGRVLVNGLAQVEPYAAFEPAAVNPSRDDFRRRFTPTGSRSVWWRQMQSLTRDGS